MLKTMMLNDRIQNFNTLQSVLRKAMEYLSTVAPDMPYSESLITSSRSLVWRRGGVTLLNVY
uniref:Sucrose synthase EPBD domain-containing protein n=1 Tax=Nelumbo nucifera TaxID=4432 RepID=A0A822YG55_NELNU|nr:TPA_asm: hypothetical protein HUJ06_009312 [Nelumbo nucifera]